MATGVQDQTEMSSFVITFSSSADAVKLGQPVPESNLLRESKRSSPQPEHR